MKPFLFFKNRIHYAFFFFFLTTVVFAQVNTGGSATTSNHQKQVIGYLSNWDAWKTTSAGVPGQGALTHLNIDYSKYTILNYSFFGVAKDGSLHSGDHRNKQIYKSSAVQEPKDIFFTDIYSSWDMHLIFGEIEAVQHINADAKQRAEAQGFEVELEGTTWKHPTWGLSGPLPLPLHKEGGAPGVIELAHQKGVKVMASIGGWSMCKHFPEMAADPVKKAKFIEDCKKLIAVGFDGIDLDWEYPGAYTGMNFTGSDADYANFASLVEDIRTAIGPDKLITAAMAADPRKLQGHNWSRLSQSMDYFNMMTYDYNGGWSNKASHNAPVYPYTDAEVSFFNWQSTLNKLVELNVPKNKICFGAPFYGRGVITQGNADLNATTVKRSENIQPDGPIQTASDFTNWKKEVYDGTPNHFFIKQKALGANSGWTRKWDNEAKVPYLVNGNFFLSYDDEESIGIKAQFINDNQLAGTIVWTVYGDLEFSGSATSFGTKLKRWSNVKSPLVNKMNEVFAGGGTGGNIAPVVSITSPANDTIFEEGTTITIKASASDPDADGSVVKVEFFDGITKLGEDTTVPYEYTLQNASIGSHSLSAKATDNEGKSTTSSLVSITVNGIDNNIPPTVSITSPVNNATYEENNAITITANAADTDGTIAKVEFFNGTTKLGEDTTAPYSFTISAATAGAYSLTASVTDDKGANTLSSVVTVTVNGDTTGGDCDGIVAWSASTTYTGGENVSYKGAQYRARWWTMNQTPNTNSGDGKPWEKIKDCGGTTGGDNLLPVVNITAPSNGGSTDSGASITISANASDPDVDGSVVKVEFFNGATKLGEDTSSPYSYILTNASEGNYTFTAKATDNKNATTISSSVIFTVNGSSTGGSCDGIVQYVAGTSYGKDVIVKNGGEQFKCNVAGWCSSSAAWAYEPGAGAHWQSAWVKTGDCGVANNISSNTATLATNISSIDTCANVVDWSSSLTYTGSEIVKYNRVRYQAKWWTLNNTPDTNNGDGLPWKVLGACNGDIVNKAPTVSISSPNNNSSFKEGTSIVVTAVASDSDGTVDKVEFYNGATKLGEDISSPYSFTISNALIGDYSLTAIATDDKNSATTSDIVMIKVNKDDIIIGEGCNGVPQYAAGTSYGLNAEVQNNVQNEAVKFKCKVAGWCSSSAAWAYEPGIGTYWEDAWAEVSKCEIPTGPSVSITSPSNNSTYTVGGSIVVNATATDNGSISKVEFFNDNIKLGEDTTEPYSYTIVNAESGKYTLTVKATDNENKTATSEAVIITDGVVTPISGKILVGYWHNFDNGSTIPKLREVSRDWDVICVAFAEPKAGSKSDMTFAPFNLYNGNVQEFKDDVAFLQGRGQKVLISMGGANAHVELNTVGDKNEFVTSMTSIINSYGFDGLDIDLEGNSVSLASGDTDFRNPTTPKITNLIAGVKEVRNNIGASRFTLSMAPETAFVQGGYGTYAGIFGAYLPVIHNLRNEMDYIHVQHYNTGSMFGKDGAIYQPATADFHVAMAEMLITGFKVAQTGLNFPGLRANQVAIGLPAEPRGAGSGYTSETVVQQALDYLIKGVSYPGRGYTTDTTYPEFRGLMTWSINWDLANNSKFSRSHRAYFDGLVSVLRSSAKLGQKEELHAYPNPASNSINLGFKNLGFERNVNSNDNMEIQIFNTNGTIVYDSKNEVNNKSKNIDISTLKSGLYFYSAVKNNKKHIGKFVKMEEGK